MEQNRPVSRVLRALVGPLVRWVGRRVERRVRRLVAELPEPPRWAVPVVAVTVAVGTILVEAGRERERAEPEPEATAERCPDPSVTDGGQEIEEALAALEVAPPPVPEADDVRAAYRRLALETHPDQGGSAEAFKDVQEAWETVSGREELSGGAGEGVVTQES